MKGLDLDFSNSREMTVTLREERASISRLASRNCAPHSRPTGSRLNHHGCCRPRTLQSKVFFRRPRYEYGVGSASPCVFQRLCNVDLSHLAGLEVGIGSAHRMTSTSLVYGCVTISDNLMPKRGTSPVTTAAGSPFYHETAIDRTKKENHSMVSRWQRVDGFSCKG